MRIAVDAMGGDHAPRVVVDGAIAAARRLGVGVLLVGRREALEAELARHGRLDRLDVVVREAPEVVGMDEPPAAVLRRKPGASIRVAAEAVARG
ncbi:MAG TPA: hypothetical protein VNK92_06235, partial [Vicinamibacterales bacterium]|nr:hypothetical protein [Vicinamibacterales bacterium]